MTDTQNQQFKIVAAITKHYIRKAADGTDRYVLEGLASNTKIDLTGERMADSAIEAMAKSLETNTVFINNEHRNGWDDDFGEVTKLWVNDNHELMMEAELDPDHYRTQTLIRGLEKGKQLGLSIGGIVKEAAMEWFAEAGRKVMTYKDIALFHVAITGTPAVADTWVTPITKSVKDWKDPSMPKEEKQVEKTEEQVTTEVEASAAAESQGADQATEEVVVEEQAEASAEEVVTEEAAAAEGDESAASEEDTTEKSDAGDSEQDTETETEADADEAAAQEEEAPASAESAPEQAQADEADVQKSAVFGDWAEISLAMGSIERLSWTLQDYVWGVMYDDDLSTEEKLASISAGLDDYKSLLLKVTAALINEGDSGAIKSAHEAFQAQTPEAVSKSLAETTDKMAALEKSLSDKTTELETAQQALAEKTTELEKATTKLEKTQTELDTIKGRKALAFTQLDNNTAEDGQTTKSVADYWAEKVYGTNERIASTSE